MKYMLLVYSPEASWKPEEWQECVRDSMSICRELDAKGQLRAASPLHSTATATTVRVRDGRRLVTAGPFTETTEQLGGYYIIDVANLDEAISIAGRLPPAKKGTVEIRPVFELQGLPDERQVIADGTTQLYMLLCYDDEGYWKAAGDDVHLAAMQEAAQITLRLDAAGQYVVAAPLHPSSTATSVRIRDGKRLVTDGPFAETREVLGGYYMLLAPGVNEALAVAAEHPGARVGAVEVRRVHELFCQQIADPSEIISVRDVPFSQTETFAAFSQPDRLARWWGPAGFRNTFREFQFQPNGHWRFVMRGPDGRDYENHNIFKAIDSPYRIVFEHVLPPQFQMTILLNKLSHDRTRIVWRGKFASPEARNEIAKFAVDCNQQSFDRLETELERGKR